MKAAVRYYSRSGNTERLARAIAEAVGVTPQTTDVPLEEDVDVLFLGSSLYGGDVDDHVKEFVRNPGAKVGAVASFSTAALASSAHKPVKRLLDSCGMALCPQEFHCPGSFAFLHRGRPNDSDCAAAADFARSVTKAAPAPN